MIKEILDEIQSASRKIPLAEYARLYSLGRKARRIFIFGMGRSGCIGRLFTIRLSHLGKQAYFVTETVCPPVSAGDVFLVISCSGETACGLSLARIARKHRAKVLGITSRKNSSLARVSHHVVTIPVVKSKQFGNSLFEQTVFLFLEAFVLFYQEKAHIPDAAMAERHTNLK